MIDFLGVRIDDDELCYILGGICVRPIQISTVAIETLVGKTRLDTGIHDQFRVAKSRSGAGFPGKGEWNVDGTDSPCPKVCKEILYRVL